MELILGSSSMAELMLLWYGITQTKQNDCDIKTIRNNAKQSITHHTTLIPSAQ